MHGGFARYVTVPAANCLALPEGVDTELGALTEPLGVGCEAVLTGEVGLGDTVLVMGPGTIGQAIALFARAAGRGTGAGRGAGGWAAVRRDAALGFNDMLDVAEAPLAELVLAATGGRKVDVVHRGDRASAHDHGRAGRVAHGGVLVVAGIHPGPGVAAADRFRACAAPAAGDAWLRPRHLGQGADHAGAGAGTFRPMITHRLPLDRGLEGFELSRQRAASKVMLRP